MLIPMKGLFMCRRLPPGVLSLQADCVENCCNKMIRGNHSMMAVFMEIQSKKQEELIKEATKRQEQAMLNPDQLLPALGAPDSVSQK